MPTAVASSAGRHHVHWRTDLALHALEQAIWTRHRAGADLAGLVHHSDRGVQYLSIRYTERLAANGVVNSVGSRGDSYDNALAESMIGLYKTELVRNKGPWRGLDDLELATLEWVDWFNHRRLFEDHGRIPPSSKRTSTVTPSLPTWQRLKPPSLHETRGGSADAPPGSVSHA
jgi:putative transposase